MVIGQNRVGDFIKTIIHRLLFTASVIVAHFHTWWVSLKEHLPGPTLLW